jgi:hypothetical protein
LRWLLPAITFVVGVALGAVVIGVTGTGSGPTSSPTPPANSRPATTTGTPSASATAVTVTVPEPCLRLADDSRNVLALVDDAAAAARDLDASKLSGIVRQLQAAQSTLKDRAAACQQAAQTSSPS